MKTLTDIMIARGWVKPASIQADPDYAVKQKRRQQIRESTARMRARKKQSP